MEGDATTGARLGAGAAAPAAEEEEEGWEEGVVVAGEYAAAYEREMGTWCWSRCTEVST